MAVNFISSIDFDETRNMHTKNDNIEILMGSETDEIVKQLFESLLQRYQEGLEKSMKIGEFVFDSVDAFCYNLDKISLNRGESDIDSPERLKNKKSTINYEHNDDKLFQYAVAVGLNHKNTAKDLQRISILSHLLISNRLSIM